MGFLSKIFGSARVPDWAHFFSESEYQAFSAELTRNLAARSLPGDVRRGSVPITTNGERGSVGFDTLARRCKGIAQDQWPREIAEFINFALTPTEAIVGPLGRDFAAASTKLRVQLVPEGFVRPNWVEGQNYVSFGTGVKVALVYDLPTCVETVPAEHPRMWNRTWDDVLRIAAANVRAELATLVPSTLDLGPETVDLGNAPMSLLEGESYFVCTSALWIESLPGADSALGVIVSIPSRHTVLYHPIRDASVWRVLASLPAKTRDIYRQLPGAISPNIFWIRGGQVRYVPVHDTGSELQVMASKELCEALMGLPET